MDDDRNYHYNLNEFYGYPQVQPDFEMDQEEIPMQQEAPQAQDYRYGNNYGNYEIYHHEVPQVYYHDNYDMYQPNIHSEDDRERRSIYHSIEMPFSDPSEELPSDQRTVEIRLSSEQYIDNLIANLRQHDMNYERCVGCYHCDGNVVVVTGYPNTNGYGADREFFERVRRLSGDEMADQVNIHY